ncbi:MAG: hypothetical protein D4S02_15420 [Rhodocyclaceae bacterium]|nr:MAG: hypothetical protein D4S02_15420 [Rhodocyclaceae bacterium]
MVIKLHNMVDLPSGKTIGEVLPAFAGVQHEFHIGRPNQNCAGCRKPFTVARKPRRKIRLYPTMAVVPIAISLQICGACIAMYQHGGADRDAMLAAVEAFAEGAKADQ